MSSSSGLECPAEVREAVCEILYTALISIRGAGYAGEAGYCALEASHVHNLPSLLNNFDLEVLRRYLDMQVPWYVKELAKFPDSNPNAYALQWGQLREVCARMAPP